MTNNKRKEVTTQDIATEMDWRVVHKSCIFLWGPMVGDEHAKYTGRIEASARPVLQDAVPWVLQISISTKCRTLHLSTREISCC